MAPLSHTFVISQVGFTPRTPNSKRAWKVNIQLDGKLLRRDHIIHDPFDGNHERIQHYLERLLAQSGDPKPQASLDSDLLDSCRKNLFSDLFRQLEHENCLSCPRIHIDVREREEPTPSPQPDTLHLLHWELLESPDLWPVDGAQVNVRKIVSPVPLGLHGVKHVSSWPMNGSRECSINILVVTARDVSTSYDGQYQDVEPFVALNAILKVKEELAIAGIRLNVEVPRLGSFEALVKHLQKAESCHGPGYFHMIHFDVHGEVGKDNIANLYFANDDPLSNDLDGLVGRSALVVADIVSRYGISCVVLNSCESATANKGFNANLSRTLCRKGISNVLAMSYKFSVSAAKIFHAAFYKAFFVKAMPFSESASYARQSLRQIQQRAGRRYRTCDIQDWFVPVVYSNGHDTKIKIPDRPEPFRAPISDRKLSRNCFISIYKGLHRRIRIGHRFLPCLGLPSLNSKSGYRQLYDDNSPPPTHEIPIPERAGDILRLEREIMEYEGHLVFLCGPPKAGKSILLRYIQRLWLSTDFCERVYIIQADQFRERSLFTKVVRQFKWRRPHDDGLSYSFRPPEDDEDESSRPDTAIIIDHLDDLYPPNPSPRQVHGQQRFQSYLSRVTNGFDASSRSQRPYLILVSRQNDREWWRRCVPDLAHEDEGNLLFRDLPDCIALV